MCDQMHLHTFNGTDVLCFVIHVLTTDKETISIGFLMIKII